MRELKFIILKDKQGKLRHYTSDFLHHSTIARDNGYNEQDIIEAGLFLDSQLYILESQNQNHLIKQANKYIGNRLNFYQDKRLKSFLKGRELESQLYYSKEPILKEGD